MLMIEGDLVNMNNVTMIEHIVGQGSLVHFIGGTTRLFQLTTPETFAQAVISGDVVHYAEARA